MKVIVPLNFSTVSALKAALIKLDDRVDIAEVWLDQVFQEFLQNPGLALEAQQILSQLKHKYNLQFLGVCKQPQEKGKFPGSAQDRVQLLNQFLRLGGDFVDVDVSQNSAALVASLPASKCWLSYHDFKTADLDIIKAQIETMKVFKPAVYKLAVTPKNEVELDAFVEFAETLEKPTILTTMGELGSLGRARLKPLTWGAFYALDEDSKTASGQPTLENL